MAESRESWFERWKNGMNTSPGGKIDVGPHQALTSVPGRQRPKPAKSSGGRVPPPSKAFARKLGP